MVAKMEIYSTTTSSEFAQALRIERLRRNLSQTEFGSLGGVSKTSQVSYEAGTSFPDVNYLKNLHMAGIDIYKLITGHSPRIENWEVVTSILLLIEEWAEKRKFDTPIDKKVTLLALLYNQFTETGRINAKDAALALKLANADEK